MNNEPKARKNLSIRDIVLHKRHHGHGRFVNPFGKKAQGRLWEVLKWKFLSRNHFKNHYDLEEVNPVLIDWQSVKTHSGLSVTYLNHASLMIKDQESCNLVDPVFFGLPFWIKNFTPLNIKPSDLPKLDHVLITHGHYDHLDLPSLKALPEGVHFITPLGYEKVMGELPPRFITTLDWFDEYPTSAGNITLLPCNHWTMRNPLEGPNCSLWGSYLIRTATQTIYISGDTAYFEGFREIGAMYDIDLAIINVGAYEPRWFMKNSHMNPVETVRAFQELGAKHLMVVHWGSFRLGDEPVFLPPRQVKEELTKVGLADRFVDIPHGCTLFYDEVDGDWKGSEGVVKSG
ncbi:MAG: MBL fold metallo-hydrolase [Proteobacteria bacterium]|nr:MBL fold metallo-hydrolase [Pseudomonadota bacterium]MBU1688878.1 MBL fold metallo-hydrolase [Pseudomonadota bacterium]